MSPAAAITLLDSTSWTGDRSTIEPVLAILHVLAVLWCARRAARRPDARQMSIATTASDRRERRTWLLLAAALAVLAAGRLFGILPHLTQVGRDIAMSQGWYETRRPVQAAILAILVVLVAIVAAGLARSTVRDLASPSRLAALAATVLLGLLILRTVSLHPVEHALDVRLGPLTLDRAAELATAIVVILAASRSTTSRQSLRPATGTA